MIEWPEMQQNTRLKTLRYAPFSLLFKVRFHLYTKTLQVPQAGKMSLIGYQYEISNIENLINRAFKQIYSYCGIRKEVDFLRSRLYTTCSLQKY